VHDLRVIGLAQHHQIGFKLTERFAQHARSYGTQSQFEFSLAVGAALGTSGQCHEIKTGMEDSGFFET
jgi:hypothetical protein